MRVSWTRGSGIVALAAVAVLLQGADAVRAQYNQYGYANQQNQGAYAAQQPWQSFAPQASGQPYAAQTQPAGRYAQPTPYTAMAYSAMEHHGEGHHQVVEQAPVASGCPTGDCQPQVSAPAPAPSYQGGYGGCDGYGCSSYNTFNGGQGYGQCAGQYAGCGCLDGACCGCRPTWFGGVYGLLMDRDRGPYVPISFSTPTPGGPGYYPTDTEVNLEVRDADIDYQGGIEFRLGAYMNGRRGGCGAGGYGGCDAYGCGGCNACDCGPSHAWEVVYWGLFEDSATRFVTDTAVDANRLYGMIDLRGLEYSFSGLVADYRPVNDYYDYGPPTEDRTAPYDVEVRQFSVRSTFSMQNIEANLLRIPALSCGCSSSACGMGGCGAGGCGAGGCDSCCSTSGYGGCGGCAPMPRYSVTTVLGARFLRMDEDFWFRTDYERMDTNATGFLAYNVETDNTLYGGQIGCRGIYRLGCSGRFALHCASNVGVYGNHIEVAQWMDAPTGGVVRFANNGNDEFYVENEKDDVSILGELRLGGSYRYSCNCRVYGGWRVMGVTGVALTTDQIPSSFNSPNQTAWIHSSGSMLIHGLQAGVEYNY